jgi:class 3 adenylate cyclase
MEGMVKILGKYGGDIIKFVGDALIVMWPEEKGSDAASMTVRKAIQCSLDIQKEMNNFQVITGVSALSVKVSILFYVLDWPRIRQVRVALRRRCF